MQIYGPAQIHGPQPLNPPHAARSAPAAAPPGQSYVDELQLSDAADLAARVHDLPDIRQDRVSALRQAIAAGTYETDDKLNLALDRLLDEIG
jgi:negative regulator of flagellin synthesis FlgM